MHSILSTVVSSKYSCLLYSSRCKMCQLLNSTSMNDGTFQRVKSIMMPCVSRMLNSPQTLPQVINLSATQKSHLPEGLKSDSLGHRPRAQSPKNPLALKAQNPFSVHPTSKPCALPLDFALSERRPTSSPTTWGVAPGYRIRALRAKAIIVNTRRIEHDAILVMSKMFIS